MLSASASQVLKAACTAPMDMASMASPPRAVAAQNAQRELYVKETRVLEMFVIVLPPVPIRGLWSGGSW